jgi:hypothetical protein
MPYPSSAFLLTGALGLTALLPWSFGMEWSTEVKVTDRHVERAAIGGPVPVMPCFGPPDEIVHVGGQQILHYRRMPSDERLRACLSATATDEMYVLVNGQGVVNELLLTKSIEQHMAQAAQLP